MNNHPTTPRTVKLQFDHLQFNQALQASFSTSERRHGNLPSVHQIPDDFFLEIEKNGKAMSFTFRMSDPKMAQELMTFLLKKEWVAPSSNLADFLGAEGIIVFDDERMSKLDVKNKKCQPETNQNSILNTVNPFLKKVNKIIEENIDNEKFRPKELSRKVFLCEMQLYRKLKKFAGLSPANYIRKFRLLKSVSFLKKPGTSVSEVCYKVGFGSLEYFSRSFKKEFGMPPSSCRLNVK